MTTHVSSDVQTQAIPRVLAAAPPGVPAAVIAAPHIELDALTSGAEDTGPGSGEKLAAPERAAESAAPNLDAAVAGKEPVQYVYETAMARLNALHDSWAAAMAEFRVHPLDIEPGKAAA
jgi:hypothetical protein